MQKTITVTMVAMQFVLGAARLDAQPAQPAPSARQSSDESGIVAGTKGGVNAARLSHEERGESRIGVVAGAWMGRRLTGVIGLQLEGLYSAKGERSFDNTIAIDYLEVPLLVMLKSAQTEHLRPMFFSGPGVEFKLRTRYDDIPDRFQEEFNQFVHGREFEWVIGAGLDAPYGTRHVTLEARYTFGLTPVFDAEPTDSDSEKRNRVFSVLVGYRFK
jgi:hypothetical protein